MTGAAKRLYQQIKTPSWWVQQSAGANRREYELWAAFREAERDYLFGRSPSNARGVVNQAHSYVHDPLAGRMGEVWGEMIFGADPVFTAASKAKQKQMDELVTENMLPSELQRAEPICVTEGEVWYRVVADPETQECPMIEWYSRLDVHPMFAGRKLSACAFIQVVEASGTTDFWRFVELQVKGKSWNMLFKGEQGKLGVEVPLASRDETAGVAPVYEHGVDEIMCGRVVNRLGRNPWWGRGDLHGVKDYLFALNEAASIGMDNARLTAKQRLVVPKSMLDEEGRFDALGIDVIEVESLDTADGMKSPIVQVETTFDAAALIAYKADLTDTIISRSGIAPQLLGQSGSKTGYAETGLGQRARLLQSVMVGGSKSRFWDDELPRMMVKAQKMAKFAFSGTLGDEPPVIKRSDTLPPEAMDLISMHAQAVGAEIESIETAVKAIKPEWDEAMVTAEVGRITKDRTAGMPKINTMEPGNQNKPAMPKPAKGAQRKPGQ